MATSNPIFPTFLAGLLLAAPVAVPALAQTTPTAATTPAPKPSTPDRRKAEVERRITDLHTHLKITPAQEKPFDDFAQVMRDNATRMDDMLQKARQSAASGTAIEQMQRYTEMAQAHAENMQHLTAAFGTLYGALSPDQQKDADQSFRQFARSRGRAPG